MTRKHLTAAAISTMVIGNSLLTFLVSAIILGIFRCDNRLEISGTVAVVLFSLQTLAGLILLTIAEDFSGPDREE